MMEIGMRTRWKGMESYTINQENWHMKVNGKQINLQGKVCFTMNYQMS